MFRRQKVKKLAEMLKKTCLYQFRQYYGSVPKANRAQSKHLALDDDVQRDKAKSSFNFEKIEKILRDLSSPEQES